MNLSDNQAADLAGVSVDFVKKVRKKRNYPSKCILLARP